MKSEKKFVDYGDRGKYNYNNKLNDLTGKEWIKFSKSWFIHRPVRRNNDEILHPAKYPESMIEEFIKFFTKKNEWILDPFLGTGSTLLAAGNLNRNAVGIELNKSYYNISSKRIAQNNFTKSIKSLVGDSLNLREVLRRNGFVRRKFDYIITSPPYWNQLERNSIRQSKRDAKGLDTKYSSLPEDIGNIESYDEFIELQARIFDQVFEVAKNKSYLTIITNNIYYRSKLYPLAYDTAISLTKRGKQSWVLKDERIWLQDDKPLIALGVNNAWVGNRHHQYCLIFRKEF